jgi:DNA repair exonuclease SbcCD ATPase subunit
VKLNALTIQARGRKRRIAFTAPVTIISGPNGAGKSTVLTSVELALAGTVTIDGKARRLPGDVFAHMSSGPAVAVFASYDCGEVSRTITRTAKGATQDLTFSGSPGEGKDGCQAAIAEQIGDLARVNVADLISKGATDRRASVLRLCRNLAKPWSMADLKASFDAAAQQATGYDHDAAPVFEFKVDRDLGLLGSCEAHATVAADAVKETTARIKSLQQAIDRMAEQTAEGASAGDSDAMAARIAELSAEIERLTAEASSIDGGNRTADVLQRRLDEWASVPSGGRDRATRRSP